METKEVLQGLKYTRTKYINNNVTVVNNTNLIAMLDDVIPKMELLLKLESESKEVE